MKEYTEAFKSKMVRKMLPPGAMTAKALARETGVNQTSLSRWLKEARTIGVMDKPAKKWTPSEKLRVVIEAGRLDDAALGEFLEAQRMTPLRDEAARASPGTSSTTAGGTAGRSPTRLNPLMMRRTSSVNPSR